MDLDPDGRFSRQMKAGIVHVAAEAPGYAPALIGPFTPNDQWQVPEIELILTKGFQARIQVVNPDGDPLPGVTLEGDYQHPAASFGNLKYTTDDHGRVAIPHAVSERMKWRIRFPGYQYEEREQVVLKPEVVTKWTLQPADPATGVVVSKATGEPVAKAKLRLIHREGAYRRTYSQVTRAPVLASFIRSLLRRRRQKRVPEA